MRGIVVTVPRFHDGIRLVATHSAISCSRLFVASTLAKWGARVIIDAAVLVVEELVATAVRATGTMEERVRWTELTRIEFITVRLLGLESSIRIEVWDIAPNPPALPAEDNSPVKRGCYPATRGKVVWAELPLLPCRRGPRGPIHPPPERQGRYQVDLGLLRRVRDGLEGL